jgi:hypothetical protein
LHDHLLWNNLRYFVDLSLPQLPMADAPFVCYRELVPPTSVVSSVFFQSYNSTARRRDVYLCTLLVAGLNIYRVCKDNTLDTPFLSLCCQKRLYGKPHNAVALHTPGQPHDLLVVAIDSAKTIVFRCNMEDNELEVVLLCNCEENAFGPGSELQVQQNGMRRYPGITSDCKVSVSSADSITCNIMFGQYLAVLPIIQSTSHKTASPEKVDVTATDVIEDSSAGVTPNSGFCVDVNNALGLPGPIIDACFLFGYARPVLVILQQSGLLPIGHAARVRHCCTLTALTVGVGSKTLSILWQRTHLPYDSLRLVPLEHTAYAGAVCVVCMNAVIFVNQEEAQGLATNGFAAATVCTVAPALKGPHLERNVGVKSGTIGLQSWVSQEEGLELDGSHWIEPPVVRSPAHVVDSSDGDVAASSRHAIVGTLKDGTILRIGMAMSTPGMLSSVLFAPEVVAASVRASCFSASPQGDLWFLGSRQATCVLLAVDHVEMAIGSPRASKMARGSNEVASSFLSPATKRQRSVSVVSNEDDGLQRLHSGAADTPAATPSKMTPAPAPAVEAMQGGEVISVEEEELALYGGSLTATQVTSTADGTARTPRTTLRGDRLMTADSLELTVVDSFPVLGPVLDGVFTKQDSHFDDADTLTWERMQESEYRAGVHSTAASYIAEREARDGLLLATGLDEDGALVRVHQGLHLSKIALRNLPGAVRVLSLQCGVYGVLLVVYEDRTRTMHCTQQVSSGHEGGAKERAELAFKELAGADCGLIGDCLTLCVGLVQPADSTDLIVAQVLPQGVRLARLNAIYGEEGEPLQDVFAAESREMGGLGGDAAERVLYGDVCAGYVTLLTSTHNLYVLKYDSQEESLELSYKIKGGSDEAQFGSEIVSVSLFHGVLDAVPPATSNGHTGSSSASTLSAQLAEEVLLYGAAVPLEGEDASMDVAAAPAPARVEEAAASTNPVPPSTAVPEPYMVVAELSGTLTIWQLSTMRPLFQCPACGTLPSCMKNDSSVLPSAKQEGLVVDSKLTRLWDPVYPGDVGRSILTLALLLSTGDLVTYRGVEAGGYLCAFHKVDQTSVSNKRAPEGTKLSNTVEADAADDMAVAERNAALKTFLGSADYLSRAGSSFSLAPAVSGARDGILVTGNDALMITSAHGLPMIVPLGFPEVPLINYGHHSVVPLCVGGIAGIAALWFEWEDLDSLKSPSTAAGRSHRAATLGIYKQAPGLEVFPAGGVSVKRLQVGRTVHRVVEMQNHSDDRTQQALLEKKTFLLACSAERKQPFLPSVLTEEELQEDSEMYERYFTNLNSFCQPDPSVGQPPMIAAREHSLALVQGTSVVDTYPLPLNECVVDADVLYLNLEKYITMPGSMVPMRFTERRVFVAACTALIEKRGEDTQGNGRLLFFALDYALFEKDSDASDAAAGGSSDGSAQSSADAATAIAKAIVSNADTNSGANKDMASAQAKFLGAIKPKLRLLWSGPGPASVVRQLGEYILSTVASTVYVYKFNTGTMDLEQVSFYFTQVGHRTIIGFSFSAYFDASIIASVVHYLRHGAQELHPSGRHAPQRAAAVLARDRPQPYPGQQGLRAHSTAEHRVPVRRQQAGYGHDGRRGQRTGVPGESQVRCYWRIFWMLDVARADVNVY